MLLITVVFVPGVELIFGVGIVDETHRFGGEKGNKNGDYSRLSLAFGGTARVPPRTIISVQVIQREPFAALLPAGPQTVPEC